MTKAGKGNKSHDVLYYIDEFFHCSCAISCRTLVPCKHVCILAIFKEEINFGEILAADADSRTHCRLDSRVIPGHTFHNIFSMPNTALLSPPKDTATERSSFMQRANNFLFRHHCHSQWHKINSGFEVQRAIHCATHAF